MPDTSIARPKTSRPPAGISLWVLPDPPKSNSILLPALVCGLLLLTVGLTLLNSVGANNGQAVFSLDDPYIHLAMAKNLAANGAWGVTPGQFTPTSSAPVYTLLLSALVFLSGPTVLWGWLFAITGGVAVAWILTARLQGAFAYKTIGLGAGLWAVIATGLPETMFTGMEHTLHALVVLLLARELSRSTDDPPRYGLLIPFAILAGGLRYESLFLIPAILGVAIFRRQIVSGLVVAFAMCIPALALGMVQIYHGGTFLPSTVMLKGVIGTQLRGNYFERLLIQIDSGVIVPLGIALGTGVLLDVLFQKSVRTNRRLPAALMYLSASIFHMAFAINERRYVVYLVALGIWALAPWLTEWLAELRSRLPLNTRPTRRMWMAFGLALVLATVFPFSERFLDLGRLPKLGQDIHAQQYQMARFFSESYAGEKVALNDIGMVAWAGGNEVFDIAGLATKDVAELFVNDAYTPDALNRLVQAEHIDVAAIYPGWLTRYGGVPREWRPVGAWLLDEGVQVNVASPQVVFFATNPNAAEPLHRRLKEFAPKLPDNVTYTPFM